MRSSSPQRPLLPSDLAQPDVAVIRAATARFITYAKNQPVDAAFDVVRRTWPGDRVTELVLERRTAVAPTMMTNASALAQHAVAGFIASASPHAGPRLIAAGLQVPMGRGATLSLPGVSTYPTAPWVSESGPIPVVQPVLAAGRLELRRIAVIAAASRTLADASVDSIETVLGVILRESVGRAFDAAVFDSSEPGLLTDVSPIGATAGGGQAALLADVDGLISAIVDAGGSSTIWLFARPGTALVLRLLAGAALDVP